MQNKTFAKSQFDKGCYIILFAIPISEKKLDSQTKTAWPKGQEVFHYWVHDSTSVSKMSLSKSQCTLMDPKINKSLVESWLLNLMYHSGLFWSTVVHEYQFFGKYSFHAQTFKLRYTRCPYKKSYLKIFMKMLENSFSWIHQFCQFCLSTELILIYMAWCLIQKLHCIIFIGMLQACHSLYLCKFFMQG